MVEIRFDYIKNFDVPESWIENVLDKSLEKKKKTVLPLPRRLYYYAAGIAACVVVAVAVILSLAFGIGKDVNLTNPNGDNAYIVEDTTDKTYATDSNGKIIPPENSPLIIDGDNESSTIVTEPDETEAEGNTKSSQLTQKSTSQSRESSKQKLNNTTKPNDYLDSQKITEIDEDKTTSPYWQDMGTTLIPYSDPSVVHTTADTNAEKTYEFYTVVFNGKAKGDVYCKLVDNNGVTVSNGLVADKTPYDGKTRISYSVFIKLNYRESYNVVFYNSYGDIIKQRTIIIYTVSKYSI